jgi:hypothetical protein
MSEMLLDLLPRMGSHSKKAARSSPITPDDEPADVDSSPTRAKPGELDE